MANLYPLTVESVQKETAESILISLGIPSELKRTFRFKPGQFVTLDLEIDGKNHRRSYSICSSPGEEHLTIGVKKVDGGLVSPLLVEQVEAGMVMNVIKPQGKFILAPAFDHRKTYFFIAGGSGITPIYSMIKTTLEEEPQSKLYLLYANQNKEGTMFHDALASLESRYKGQLTVTYAYSRPKKSILPFFNSEDIATQLPRLTPEILEDYLSQTPIPYLDVHYYVCGPTKMMDMAIELIEGKGNGVIHTESFVSNNIADEQTASIENGLQDIMLKTTLDGDLIESKLKPGESILDHLLKEGHNPPYACCAGNCSTCVAKLKTGEVSMAKTSGLEPDELVDGYILTCQAIAITPEVVISFDE